MIQDVLVVFQMEIRVQFDWTSICRVVSLERAQIICVMAIYHNRGCLS